MIKLFKSRQWLFYAILAALFWGLWGVIAKLISSDISPYVNHFLFTLGMLLTFPLVAKKCKTKEVNSKGIVWGLIAGILAVVGNIAVYKAFGSGGQAAIVIPVTNLYPLVTIVIALLIFKEKLSWINGLGILLAIPAILMLSGESLLFDNPSAFIRSIGLNLWLMFSLVALFFWGVFSAAQKVTTNYISAEWSYASFIISSVLITLVFVAIGWININFNLNTLMLGIIAGALNGLGVLASFAAYRAEGKASQVTTIAGALQPVFTIALAIVFLGESLSIIEFLGIVLAILGALALSYEKKKESLLVAELEPS